MGFYKRIKHRNLFYRVFCQLCATLLFGSFFLAQFKLAVVVVVVVVFFFISFVKSFVVIVVYIVYVCFIYRISMIETKDRCSRKECLI